MAGPSQEMGHIHTNSYKQPAAAAGRRAVSVLTLTNQNNVQLSAVISWAQLRLLWWWEEMWPWEEWAGDTLSRLNNNIGEDCSGALYLQHTLLCKGNSHQTGVFGCRGGKRIRRFYRSPCLYYYFLPRVVAAHQLKPNLLTGHHSIRGPAVAAAQQAQIG